MPLKLSAAAAASQGARPYQEDTSAIWQPPVEVEGDAPLLAVVADGMGGHVSGEVASQLACQAFIDTFGASDGEIRDRLEQALTAANDAIANAIAARPELNGMGCTLVAAYFDAQGLWHVSVGDSLLLLLREEVLHGLNENHSFGAVLDQQAEAGLISPEDAQSNPRRNSLRSALTGERIALVDLPAEPYPIKAGDCVVLASDGLDTLNGHEIADLVVGNTANDAESIASVLLAAVDAHGLPNQDNTTVVALRVEDGGGEAAKTVQWLPGRDADDVNTTITVSPEQRVAALNLPTPSRRSFLVPTLFFAGVVAASLAALFWWANQKEPVAQSGDGKAVSGSEAAKKSGKAAAPPVRKKAEPAKQPVKTKPEPLKDSATAKPGKGARKSDGGSDGGGAQDADPAKGDKPPSTGKAKSDTKSKSGSKSKAGSKSKSNSKSKSGAKPKAGSKSKTKAPPVPKAGSGKEGRLLPAPGATRPERFAQRRGLLPEALEPDDLDLEGYGRRLLLPFPQARKQ